MNALTVLMFVAMATCLLLPSTLARPRGGRASSAVDDDADRDASLDADDAEEHAESLSRLTRDAQGLMTALDDIMTRMRAEEDALDLSRPRRRRYVHFHIGRRNHHPTFRMRFARGRREYRRQHGGRNPNIADH